MNNFDDPTKFLKSVFKIVGHTESESDELAKTFVDGAKKKAILICYTKLHIEKRKPIDEMLAKGEKIEEIIVKVIGELGAEEYFKTLTGISFQMMKEYASSIVDKLSEDQKLSIAKILDVK